MGIPTYQSPRLRLAGLMGLLVLGLLAPQLGAAPAAASAACPGGVALWADSRTRSDALLISGSNTAVAGGVRSNADISLGGSGLRIDGPVTFATSFRNGGDGNRFPTPTRAAATDPPVSYDLAAYRPGGAAAQAAQAAGLYTLVRGDMEVAEARALSGLYYVTGNAKLSASGVWGAATIVAEGEIELSGSLQQLQPYAGGLLLFAGKSAPGSAVIKLAGAASSLQGVIYGPRGVVELSGDRTSIAGLVLGDTLKLGGSSMQITFAGEHCPGQPGPAPEPAGYAPGEVVVKLFRAGDLAAVAAANGLDPAPLDQFGSRPIYRLRILDGASPLAKAAQLRPAFGSGGDARVEYAEPNYFTQDPESRGSRGSWVIGQENQTTYAEQWAPPLIRLPVAHQRSLGRGVTVAVLDTGVDRQHPALAGRLTAGFDFVDFDNDPSEGGTRETSVSFGHGTHVAGLVALAAPEARIMPVRVLDANGVGNVWVLSEGLLYAAERGPDGVALNGDEPLVINLSLGTTRPTRLLEDLLAEVTCAAGEDDDDDDGGAGDRRCRMTRGVMVVAAAGNGGNSVPQYPAAENVAGSLAVGASTRADTRADFSTFGPWVRLAAPGAEVVSTVPGGAYGVWSGTSMAAPLTAGVAALVRAAEPNLSATAVVERLITTARPIPGETPLRLDAGAALGFPFVAGASSRGAHNLFVPAVYR